VPRHRHTSQSRITVDSVVNPSEPHQEAQAPESANDDDTPRPLLFLDVDGPLNPYASRLKGTPPGYVRHRMRPASWATNQPRLSFQFVRRARSLRVWLNPAHGPRLLKLEFDLVWATTWEHDANIWIGPAIGLPELPVVSLRPSEAARQDPDGLYWKTRSVVEFAAGRPFAWVDDYVTRTDGRWCAEHHPTPTLLLPINPARGLAESDFAALARWADLHREDNAQR
jgi:hypothetical protein